MAYLNFSHLSSAKPEVNYCAAKKVIVLSEKNPRALYRKLDIFIKLLDGENQVLKWVAIIIIGNLARTDSKNRIGKMVPRLIDYLRGKGVIMAANSIKALGKIAQVKPRYREKIFRNFLLVEKARYYNKGRLSLECRNVAIGHAITTLSEFGDGLKWRKDIIAFLKRQTKNTRPAVWKKAEKLLKTNIVYEWIIDTTARYRRYLNLT